MLKNQSFSLRVLELTSDDEIHAIITPAFIGMAFIIMCEIVIGLFPSLFFAITAIGSLGVSIAIGYGTYYCLKIRKLRGRTCFCKTLWYMWFFFSLFIGITTTLSVLILICLHGTNIDAISTLGLALGTIIISFICFLGGKYYERKVWEERR